MLDAKTLEKLKSFDTPTICNIIELFDVRPRTAGYMDARIRAWFPGLPPMVGYAATATVRSYAPQTRDPTYHWLPAQVEHFAELPGPPVVVLQDLDDPPVAATFGEVMCTTYQAFGAIGLVSSGAGRDLEQVQALNFPVFTDGINCSHGYFHVVDIHVPVSVGGLVVRPGDLLHGDGNGVTTIPLEIAAEVADVGDTFVAAERVILDAMRGPAPSVKTLVEAQAESRAMIAELAARVSRA